MRQDGIDQFAELLVKHVRDQAILGCDVRGQPHAKGPVAARWKEAVGARLGEFSQSIVPDIVDETIYSLLRAIDDGTLRLSFTTTTGEVVDLNKDGVGELAGWYLGSESWRERFSDQRFNEF